MINAIIFDWKRTLYDPEKQILVKGAKKLLLFLKEQRIPLILIGKGDEQMKQEVKRLKVCNYFTQVIFKPTKDLNLFAKFIFHKQPKNTYIIGDRVRAEIEIGNRLKMTTIWVKQGKFSEELPLSLYQKPGFTVLSLFELLALFKDSNHPYCCVKK